MMFAVQYASITYVSMIMKRRLNNETGQYYNI